MIEKEFNSYCLMYVNILKHFYPSLGSTGFQERNQTVLFSKAYEKENSVDDVICWFEFQFGNKRNNHFDCVIINKTKHELFIIEPKRFNRYSKKESINDDIKRICDYSLLDFSDDKRFIDYQNYKIYGLILSDIWLENKQKTSIYESFENKVYFKDNKYVNNKKQEYQSFSFNIENCKAKYALLAFVWEVK